MAAVSRWTGVEARALRHARRMSITAFAQHLGVTERTISKWEAGRESVTPRPVNQEALDTSLHRSPPDVQARFQALTGVAKAAISEDRAGGDGDVSGIGHLRHPGDGKIMAHVAEGTFLSGPDNGELWLPGYWIDVYPTTNADYARFIAASGHAPPRHWPAGQYPPDLADHPVVWVTWHDANAYADWAGKTLPTALQWEKAARGPYGTAYPWGDAGTAAKGNFRESRVGFTTPVDRYHSGVSSYGVYDMCGNTWEWLSTETQPGRYELKGSAFSSPFHRAKPANFNDASVDMLDDDTGFRCVSADIAAPTG